MTKEECKALQIAACQIRMGVIESTHGAKAGHPGGSLSAADMFAYLYKKEMRIDPQNPQWENRDRFVLSKGHTAPGLYSALAYRGFFPVADLPTLRHIDSYLQGHPNMNTVPGVDMSTGSLGQGVSCAAGMAKAAKYLKQDEVRVYTLLGDGEIEEGEVWEAFLFAAHYKLDNFCAIIDLNGLQIDGATKDVMNTEPVDAKMRDFGFHVVSIDGHDFAQIENAFAEFHARKGTGVPTAILPGCEPDVIPRLFAGETIGTWVRPEQRTVSRRKYWLAYQADPQGTLYLDTGAADAVRNHGKSLLPGGITEVHGSFEAGALVRLVYDRETVGVGLSNYNAADLLRIRGLKRHEVAAILGDAHYPEVVHRDNLLLDAAL